MERWLPGDAAERLTNINQLISTVGFWVVLILSIVSLFIISNTIWVTNVFPPPEISIMKSVGATGLVYPGPFIVEGIIIGVISTIGSDPPAGSAYETPSALFSSLSPSHTYRLTACYAGSWDSFCRYPLRRHRRRDIHQQIPEERGRRYHWLVKGTSRAYRVGAGGLPDCAAQCAP